MTKVKMVPNVANAFDEFVQANPAPAPPLPSSEMISLARVEAALTDDLLARLAARGEVAHNTRSAVIQVREIEKMRADIVTALRASEPPPAQRLLTVAEVMMALSAERLHEDTGTEGDIAYNRAVDDCLEAVRALCPSDPPPEGQ